MGDADLPELQPGDFIKNRFQVDRKLGQGGFGAVYTVIDKTTNQKHAMKVEGAKDPIQILKMEVVVLQECTDKRGGRHVCKIIDKGRNPAFNYIIMTLVGQSLQDLKNACPNKRLTPGSAFRVGIQCLEAVEDLHRIGYLHRDVKPGNFAVGREETNDQRHVYILDFGLARKFMKETTGQIRTPRAAAGFRGTLRYAPLNCHHSKELSRKDDLETWLYQQVEITKGRLPWADMNDMEEVKRTKASSRSGELVRGTPPEYQTLLRYIDGLSYWDVPDYNFVYTQLRQAMQQVGCRDSDPYDWERGGQHRNQTQMLPAQPQYNPHQGAPILNIGGGANY